MSMGQEQDGGVLLRVSAKRVAKSLIATDGKDSLTACSGAQSTDRDLLHSPSGHPVRHACAKHAARSPSFLPPYTDPHESIS
jgi:hypothetical protein